MEADDEMSPWTRICISQADCILLVAPEDAAPAVRFLTCSLSTSYDVQKAQTDRLGHRLSTLRTSGSGLATHCSKLQLAQEWVQMYFVARSGQRLVSQTLSFS